MGNLATLPRSGRVTTSNTYGDPPHGWPTTPLCQSTFSKRQAHQVHGFCVLDKNCRDSAPPHSNFSRSQGVEVARYDAMRGNSRAREHLSIVGFETASRYNF